MRSLGIDYGTKNIGLALSDESGTLAFPFDIIDNDDMLVERTLRIAKENGAKRIVIGESRMADQDNAIMKKIRTFSDALKKAVDVDVYFEPEQFSSAEAMRFQPQKGKQKRDDAAAAIILQRFLDREVTQPDAR